jgi:hypothetical protein
MIQKKDKMLKVLKLKYAIEKTHLRIATNKNGWT